MLAMIPPSELAAIKARAAQVFSAQHQVSVFECQELLEELGYVTPALLAMIEELQAENERLKSTMISRKEAEEHGAYFG